MSDADTSPIQPPGAELRLARSARQPRAVKRTAPVPQVFRTCCRPATPSSTAGRSNRAARDHTEKVPNPLHRLIESRRHGGCPTQAGRRSPSWLARPAPCVLPVTRAFKTKSPVRVEKPQRTKTEEAQIERLHSKALKERIKITIQPNEPFATRRRRRFSARTSAMAAHGISANQATHHPRSQQRLRRRITTGPPPRTRALRGYAFEPVSTLPENALEPPA